MAHLESHLHAHTHVRSGFIFHDVQNLLKFYCDLKKQTNEPVRLLDMVSVMHWGSGRSLLTYVCTTADVPYNHNPRLERR